MHCYSTYGARLQCCCMTYRQQFEHFFPFALVFSAACQITRHWKKHTQNKHKNSFDCSIDRWLSSFQPVWVCIVLFFSVKFYFVCLFVWLFKFLWRYFTARCLFFSIRFLFAAADFVWGVRWKWKCQMFTVVQVNCLVVNVHLYYNI